MKRGLLRWDDNTDIEKIIQGGQNRGPDEEGIVTLMYRPRLVGVSLSQNRGPDEEGIVT